MVRKTVAVLVLLLVSLACGKRGDPRPPVPIVPQTTSDLVVTQRADKIVLTWSYPSLTTTGRSLTDLRRISVYRHREELPLSALRNEGGDPAVRADDDPATPQAVTLFGRIPTLPKSQFEKLSTRIESIDNANLASATAGGTLVYVDSPSFRTSDDRPVRLTYAVVTEGGAARSGYSNMATIVPLPVALPPASLKATASAEGVVLNWERPSASIMGDDSPVIVGYNVFRTAPGEAPGEFAAPISNAPVVSTTYTDTPPYGEHEYRVTAVAATGTPVIQSNLSEPARATFRDLVPPPVPSDVTVLLETKFSRLIWQPVAAADLAGYNVYRIEGPYRLKLTPQLLTEPNFTDISLDLGIAYHYEVTSVDKSGNESAPAVTEKIIVPKTP